MKTIFYQYLCWVTYLFIFYFYNPVYLYNFSNNNNLKPTNVMSCHEPNWEYEAGDEECEDQEKENVVLEHVDKEFW